MKNLAQVILAVLDNTLQRAYAKVNRQRIALFLGKSRKQPNLLERMERWNEMSEDEKWKHYHTVQETLVADWSDAFAYQKQLSSEDLTIFRGVCNSYDGNVGEITAMMADGWYAPDMPRH